VEHSLFVIEMIVLKLLGLGTVNLQRAEKCVAANRFGKSVLPWSDSAFSDFQQHLLLVLTNHVFRKTGQAGDYRPQAWSRPVRDSSGPL
jgi:hypothetical protein